MAEIRTDRRNERNADSVLATPPRIGTTAGGANAVQRSLDVLTGSSALASGRDRLVEQGERAGDALQSASLIAELTLATTGLALNIVPNTLGIRSEDRSAGNSVLESQPNPAERRGEPVSTSVRLSEREGTQMADSVMKIDEIVCPLNIVFDVGGETQTATSRLVGGGYVLESVYRRPAEIGCRVWVDRNPNREDTEQSVQALSFHQQDSTLIWQMGAVIADLRTRMQPARIVNPVLNEMGIQYAVITRYRVSPQPGSMLFELSFSMQEVDKTMLTLFVPE